MELERGVTVREADQNATARESFVELAEENARLRRLVGELLLKNQQLRAGSSIERIG